MHQSARRQRAGATQVDLILRAKAPLPAGRERRVITELRTVEVRRTTNRNGSCAGGVGPEPRVLEIQEAQRSVDRQAIYRSYRGFQLDTLDVGISCVDRQSARSAETGASNRRTVAKRQLDYLGTC